MGLFKKKEKKPQSEQAVLTIYANHKSYEDIPDMMAEIFKDTMTAMEPTEDGTEFTLQDSSTVRFHFMNKMQ